VHPVWSERAKRDCRPHCVEAFRELRLKELVCSSLQNNASTTTIWCNKANAPSFVTKLAFKTKAFVTYAVTCAQTKAPLVRRGRFVRRYPLLRE
jgi:hypothetical protein